MVSAYYIVPEKSLVCSNWTACHGILAEAGIGPKWKQNCHFGAIGTLWVLQEVKKKCVGVYFASYWTLFDVVMFVFEEKTGLAVKRNKNSDN